MKIIDLLKKQRSKKFINPYYRVEKSRLSIINSSLRIKIIVIEVLVLVIGLTWFFYYSTVFNVNVIDVIGARRIPKDEVTRVIRATLNEGALLRNSLNLFILDIDKLKQKLNSKYYLTSLISNGFARSITRPTSSM